MNAQIDRTLESKIEAELDRLDSYNKGQGIVCAFEGDLPAGWVRVYDGHGEAWGEASEILAALEAMEYDPKEIVGRGEPVACYDPDCYGGRLPSDEGDLHAHDGDPLTAESEGKGYQLAWEALAEFDTKPDSTRNWPDNLFTVEQLEEGTINDNPNTLIIVQTNAGTRYAAGPHGFSCCALGDWIDEIGELAESREEAIDAACELEESE